jgi:methionyl-tRNA formyltransferase
MIFIGSGSMLRRAVSFTLSKGFSVECIITQKENISIKIFEKNVGKIIYSDDPNQECDLIKKYLKDKIIFSLNNKFILKDKILNLDANIYNIHNGLVQNYRGIGEVCIYTAICRNEKTYGATLHKILPGQDVDSGPVISQEIFTIMRDDSFADVFLKSMQTCDLVFKKNLDMIVKNKFKEIEVIRSGEVFTFKSIEVESKKSSKRNLKRAQNLGNFSGMLPILKKKIKLLN